MSREYRLSLAFLGVMAALLLQFLVAKKYDEPYPSIVFPGFGKVYTDLYPYDYERLHLYAHTAHDSVELTMEEVFAPFTEVALFAPMRVRLKSIPDTLTMRNGSAQEQELLRYLQQRMDTLLEEKAQRLALVFYEYQDNNNGERRLLGNTRKILYFDE